jgi:hypothetical protein
LATVRARPGGVAGFGVGADLLGGGAGRIEHGSLDIGPPDVDAQREGATARYAWPFVLGMALAVDIQTTSLAVELAAPGRPGSPSAAQPEPNARDAPVLRLRRVALLADLACLTISFLARSTNVANSH